VIRAQDLKQYEVFSELDLSELAVLARLGEETHGIEGEVLIQAGTPARTLYIMESGNVMVAVRDGRAFTLHAPGSVVGWSALVHPTAYWATTICLTDSTFIAFAGSELLRLTQGNVALGTKLMRKLSDLVSKRLFMPEPVD
jgi:CRP-like cAMP-binding protein